ncbi:MAG: hypothetical protein CME38_18890 [Haliea sp.]|nr:hypothetical protein [Haliea sp.]|tara:strand:- start:1786 stop:2289 length:504 start_codon:yes stop_codon:yes gene_type:complete
MRFAEALGAKKMKGCMPLVGALLILACATVFHEPIAAHLGNPDSRVQLENLYAAVFDWSAIQTGFLFAVYGFVVGKNDGFIGAIRKTPAMGKFTASLRRAILVGFLLTFTSMMLLLYPLQPIAWEYWVLSLWLALFMWAFFLFCSVALTFGVIVKVPDHDLMKRRDH